MANNTLLTTSMIANESLRILENNLVFGKQVNRQYDNKFAKSGAKIGNTLNVRLPVAYTGTNGRTLNVEDTIETSVPVVLNKQFHVAMEFTSEDLALKIDAFSDRYIKPALAKIANEVDSDGLKLVEMIPNTVGSPTALADQLRTYLAAGAKMDSEGVPRDDLRAIVIGPFTQAAIVDGLKGLFNDVNEVARQYREGTMGRTIGYKWSMDQNVVSHTNGTGTEDPVQVNGANQDGNTLTIKALVGNLKKGDTFTIDGVYAVNPMSKVTTGQLKQFVVTEDVTAAGTTVKISPEIITTGPYKNVTAAPANEANLTFVGAAGATYELGVAFHRDAFVLACADLPLPTGTDKAARVSDDQLGLSIRLITDYDINTDKMITRVDILYGWSILRSELACKIISDPTKF